MGIKTVTAAGNAQVSTAQSVFGGASLLLDGVGDYLSTPDNADFNFGSGDFTIDFRVRFTSLTGLQILLAKRTSSVGSINFAVVLNGGAIQLFLSSNGSSWDIVSAGSFGTPSANVWYHVAAVRNGTAITGYFNGTGTALATSSASLFVNTSPVFIGSDSDTQGVVGNMDEIRISKGIARWTANFTPPTSAYDFDSQTVLLLHCDGANTSTVFKDDSYPNMPFYKPYRGSFLRFFRGMPDLIASYQFNDNFSLSDSSGNGNTLTNNAASTFLAGKFDKAVNCVRASLQYLSIASTLSYSGGAYSIIAWFSPNSQPTSGQLYTIGSVAEATTNTNLWIGYYNNAGTLSVFAARTKYAVADQGPVTAQTLQNGIWYCLGITYDGTNVKSYLNGALLGTPTAASGSGTAGGSNASAVGSFAAFNTSHLMDGKVSEIAFVKRELTAQEFSQYYKWATASVSTSRFGRLASLGIAYTLALVQGSYTLTGQALNMIKAMLMSLVQGSYTLTGQIVSFLSHIAHSVMTMAQGVYTLTGNTALFYKGWFLILAQGSYTLTGKAITMIKGYGMSLLQGAYTLTGQAATFTWGRFRGLIRGRDSSTNTIVGKNNNSNTIIGRRT